MVRNPADLQRSHFVFACDAAEVWPEPFLKIVRDERTTFFGAENDVHKATDK
jgi:hypothetical protein